MNFKDLDGCELAPDVIYLGRAGCFRTNGLSIAYVSGKDGHEDYEADSRRLKTLEVSSKCEEFGFKGVDILIVWKHFWLLLGFSEWVDLSQNISCVSGRLFQAEFVHKILGMLTQCRADIRAKQTARLLVFHRFPIGSGRGTAHTANEANPFVPPIQVSAVFGQIWKSQFFTNPSILFRVNTVPAHRSHLLLPGFCPFHPRMIMEVKQKH